MHIILQIQIQVHQYSFLLTTPTSIHPSIPLLINPTSPQLQTNTTHTLKKNRTFALAQTQAQTEIPCTTTITSTANYPCNTGFTSTRYLATIYEEDFVDCGGCELVTKTEVFNCPVSGFLLAISFPYLFCARVLLDIRFRGAVSVCVNVLRRKRCVAVHIDHAILVLCRDEEMGRGCGEILRRC